LSEGQAIHGENEDDPPNTTSPGAAYLIQFPFIATIGISALPPFLDLLVVLFTSGPQVDGLDGPGRKEGNQQRDQLQQSACLKYRGAIPQHGRIHGIHGRFCEEKGENQAVHSEDFLQKEDSFNDTWSQNMPKNHRKMPKKVLPYVMTCYEYML
jgi:hypothetical protein